jgi:hypothetical protein
LRRVDALALCHLRLVARIDARHGVAARRVEVECADGEGEAEGDQAGARQQQETAA